MPLYQNYVEHGVRAHQHWGKDKATNTGIAEYTSLQGIGIALTGTATPSATEAQIVAGGRTVIITLTGAEWIPAGAEFNAQRQAILDGFVSAQSEANGWNAEQDGLAVTNVVRTSATVVTVTFSALASYSITADETVTVTIPIGPIDLVTTPVEAGSFSIIAA